MVRDFLNWWGAQLADCVPEEWRRVGSSGGEALLIAPLGAVAGGVQAVVMSLRRNGRETPLGHFGLPLDNLLDRSRWTGKPAVLRLVKQDVLAKTVTLPLAAERDLAQVLAFEMDRETPFNAEEVFWTYRVTRRERQRGQLSVRLLLVPRATLIPLLDALGEAGIVTRHAEIAEGPDQGFALPLDSKGGGLYAATAPHLLRWPAAAVCAGLALAVIAMPFARQASAIAALDREIGQGRSAAAEAGKLRQEIERLSGAAELIDSERDKAGRPLVVLATLTRMLPGDTYLTEFRQQQHKVTVSGRSAAASRLIGALSGGTQLRNPTFAAPVTRIEALRSEVFTITAEVAP